MRFCLALVCLLAGCTAAPAAPAAPATPAASSPAMRTTTQTIPPRRDASGVPLPVPYKLPLGSGELTLVWMDNGHVWQCSAAASAEVSFATLDADCYDALGYADVLDRAARLPQPTDALVAGSKHGPAVLVARQARSALKALVSEDGIQLTSWEPSS